MAEHSKIEWTEATWNPITGCSVVSPGCTNCYAMKLAGGRLRNHPSRKGLTSPSKAGPVWNGKVRFNEDWLDQPLRWTRARRIFVCAHGDLFHEDVPDEWIDRAFAVMALAPQHQFQVLTKRAGRMREYVAGLMADQSLGLNRLGVTALWTGLIIHPSRGAIPGWPLPNVWLGVSVEDQKRADERIPDLLATPAAVRFLSVEPMLGPIKLWVYDEDEGALRGPGVVVSGGMTASTPHDPPEGYDDSYPGIDWVICGGESGPGARPMHPDWARSIRDQCVAAGVPFFFKQWGQWAPDFGSVADWDPARWVAKTVRFHDFWGESRENPEARVWGIGKKQAGRLLDGVTWDQMPGRRRKATA